MPDDRLVHAMADRYAAAGGDAGELGQASATLAALAGTIRRYVSGADDRGAPAGPMDAQPASRAPRGGHARPAGEMPAPRERTVSSAPHDLGIRACAARIERGELSPVELTEHFLDRIERLDPQLRSYARVTADLARDQARQARDEIRSGRYRGPLHGIPLALKDIIDTAGIATEAGSRLLRGRIPATDAAVWSRLREAGAVLLGKLHTHEFASGGPGRVSDGPYDFQALNPWNPRRYAGGSSNGAASAVAGGLCMGAVGTDTGGSIRIPASYCGVAGFKPGFGNVDTAGILPLSETLDHCGPLAWTADDAALLYDGMRAASAPRAPDAGDARPRGMRIAYVRHFGIEAGAAAPVLRAVDAAAGRLRALGARVEEIALPPLALFTAVNSTLFLAEAYAVHEASLRRAADLYSMHCKARLFLGGCLSAADYIRAQQARRRLIAETAARMDGFDALVCVSTPGAAPDAQRAADETQKFFFLQAPVPCAPFNLLGAPAISICCGLDEDRMPLALQIAAPPGGDTAVLRVAAALEAALPPRPRPPGYA